MSGTPDLERGPSDKDSKPPLPVLEDEVAPDDMDPTPPRSAPGNEAAPDQSGNGDGTNGIYSLPI